MLKSQKEILFTT